MIFFGSAWPSAASRSSDSWSVLGSFVMPVRFWTGSFSLVEQDLPQLLQRADVELAPGERVDLLLDRRRARFAISAPSFVRNGTSRRMPVNSISASTPMSGTSSSS